MAINIIGEGKERMKEYDLKDYQQGITPVVDATELGDSLRELNNDEIEKETRMSGIDMRSRLYYSEISAVLAVDTLVAFGFLPIRCLSFTRQKKRLSVSIDGMGRREIVDIVGGKRDQDAKVGREGMIQRMKSFMQPGSGGQ